LECYVGQHESFVLPTCKLYRLNKEFTRFRALEKYIFSQKAGGEVCSQLANQNLLDDEPEFEANE